MMDIRIHEHANNTQELIIALSGSLNDSASKNLCEQLLTLCEGKIRDSIVVDLKQCEPESALAFGALVSFRLSPPIAGKTVTLINLNTPWKEAALKLRLNVIFEIPEREIFSGEGKQSE